ncbi:MAG TPA: hypothetical protein DIT01_03745 [Lentisphaeria bacterium]|nr:hypothetical protein [Lentisphaeria bacterium]
MDPLAEAAGRHQDCDNCDCEWSHFFSLLSDSFEAGGVLPDFPVPPIALCDFFYRIATLPDIPLPDKIL